MLFGKAKIYTFFFSPRAEVKRILSYTSTPPYIFMAWCLIKYTDDFIEYFIQFLYVSF
jgi:hypothetical protein